ncbi:unnamed protein product, partial [Heterosigma akashiwo]
MATNLTNVGTLMGLVRMLCQRPATTKMAILHLWCQRSLSAAAQRRRGRESKPPQKDKTSTPCYGARAGTIHSSSKQSSPIQGRSAAKVPGGQRVTEAHYICASSK